VSQGTIGYERNIKLTSSWYQAIVLVKGLEWGELRLDGVDLCNYRQVSFKVMLSERD
jgi:hypothetical protein